MSDLLVPQHRRHYRAQMPQAMRINHPPPRREIHQFHAHSNDDPSNTHARPYRPRPPNSPVLHITKPAPQHIRHNANYHVRRHVVRVVPLPQRKVRDMHGIQQPAQHRPNPQCRRLPRLRAIEPKHANWGVVQSIQHIRARREIIQLLRNIEIPHMKNHAKRPAREAHVPETQIVLPERVCGRDVGAQLRHAPRVRDVVQQREDDAEGLLHAQEPVEGPFAVKLDDRLQIRRVAREASGGDDVLACVVAFGGAGPEKKAAVKSCPQSLVREG
jgi:hypothetical protein